MKLDAILLQKIVGKLSVDRRELWEGVSAVVLGREWDPGKARIFVCWIAADEDGDLLSNPIHRLCCSLLLSSQPISLQGRRVLDFVRSYQTFSAFSPSL
jgi:hypothetical protein